MSQITFAHCRHPAVLAATGFGVGLSPWAPGTAASLVALPIWWFGLSQLALPATVVLLSVVCVVAVWIAAVACRVVGVGDDGAIVIDEWVGMWIALLGCPRTLWAMVAAFALFRLFDIAKPWPVSWADREVGGGLGVVLDDVLAGLLAAGVLQLSFLVIAYI
ncbi:MAG: phosphatidylglycerophosphatase A [Gammaproteobacteria bacterium]|nr:phosphatidylglycerophosphatase A [Gammaproteobacteria bacterium]